ncbi:MAG: two-component sensor histidine kinase [Robiginitomaculum sp.]|nr:MAG: two-component sensor histidine kinase [Robiginitomaculum sp.]
MLASTKRLFKNTAFRLSMIAATLFAVSSMIVLGYVYYASVTVIINQIDHDLYEELSELETFYHKRGPDELNKIIILRMLQPRTEMKYVYVYNGNLPTGNLNTQPTFTDTKKWGLQKLFTDLNDKPVRQFIYSVAAIGDNQDSTIVHRARGQLVQLNKADKLFIARDVERILEPAEVLSRALFISAAMALLLGALSGIFLAKRFSNRIATFNKLATDVRAGHLNQRMERNESGDELDVLAEHLNSMLDHIDRLMQAMRYAGDSIAHDLRSPLTRLRTRLENAGHEIEDEGAQTALLAASEDAGELLRTFDSVLRIARLEAGERRELLIALDPRSLLEDMAELYEPSCEDAGLEFSMEITGKHKIRADRGLLSQAVSNLVENAIKYTPRGGAIKLRLRKVSSGRTEISITDTGVGIPQEDRQRVKERFVRLEKSRTKPGSGLGLSLVTAIADLHQAQFELSDGPGGDGSESPGLRAALIFPRVKRS